MMKGKMMAGGWAEKAAGQGARAVQGAGIMREVLIARGNSHAAEQILFLIGLYILGMLVMWVGEKSMGPRERRGKKPADFLYRGAVVITAVIFFGWLAGVALIQGILVVWKMLMGER